MRKSSVRAPSTTQRRQLKRVRKVEGECGLLVKPSLGTVRIDLTRIEGIASHYDAGLRTGGTRFHKALPNRHQFVRNRMPFWPLIPSRRAARDRVQRLGHQGHGPAVDQAQPAGLQQPRRRCVARGLPGADALAGRARPIGRLRVLPRGPARHHLRGARRLLHGVPADRQGRAIAYGLEASPQNVNVTTKEEWIYRLVPDAEKGVGLGRRTTHRFLGYYHYTLVDIDGRWWITDVQSASEIWLP